MSVELSEQRKRRVSGPARARAWSARLVLAGVLFCGSHLLAVDMADVAVSPPGRLQMLDGSSLRGRLHSAKPADGIAWEHAEAKSILRFRPDHVAAIGFEKPQPVQMPEQPTSRFRFQNGDELLGNLLSLSDEDVELQTWFGARVRADRAALKSIGFLPGGYSILYEGPHDPENWNMSRSAKGWRHTDGAFETGGVGTLGRDLKLPRLSSVEFDLAWTAPFSLSVALYTEVFDRFDYNTSSYVLYLSQGSVALQRIQTGVSMLRLGDAQITNMVNRGQIRLEIRSNQDEGTLALLADGVLVQRWRDNNGFAARGTGLLFHSQMESPLKISNIRVSRWDGRYERPAHFSAENIPQDVVYLANRDRIVGQIASIGESGLQMEALGAMLDIPMHRITEIAFAEKDKARPAFPWEVRAHVAHGGTVAFQLESWSPEEVVGRSAHLGPIALSTRSIRQLQFNLTRTRDSLQRQDPFADFFNDQE